jgi:RNA polymerase sigma factor (sigma-70 family)
MLKQTPAQHAPTLGDLFTAHYGGLVRLAGLLGADDPEDLAQEAFARLHGRTRALRDPHAALAYLRATVCNLTRNRARHLRIVRLRTPRPAGHEAAADQSAILREDHRELLAALAELPTRQREALVMRYWLDLSERAIADAMGVSTGTVKTHASRGLAALATKLEDKR